MPGHSGTIDRPLSPHGVEASAPAAYDTRSRQGAGVATITGPDRDGQRPAAPRLCFYTRAWRSSGTGLFAQELAQGLVDAGGQILFIAPTAQQARFEQSRPGLTRLRPPHEMPGAPRLGNLLRSVGRIAGGAASLLRARMTHRTFLVSIPDPLAFFLPIMALLTLSRAKIIFIAHDPLPHAWHLPASLRWLERAAHAACYRLAHRVVVLSEPTAVQMRQLFPFARDRIEVIEHGIFPIEGVPPIRGEGTLLIFGSLRRNKGIVEGMAGVIAARAAGMAVRLIVAGAPTRDEADYGREIARVAASAPDGIDLRLGYVDDEALKTLLVACDALLLPYTDFHSQSGVALLAASNARPIIAASAGGIGALIAEGMPAATIAAPISPQTVQDAIERFVAEPVESWRKTAQAYRARTMDERSWAAIGGHYLALARSLQR